MINITPQKKQDLFDITATLYTNISSVFLELLVLNMDAIVQFIRNALCCIKDLQLFEEYGIHDAKLSLQLIGGDIPEPFHKTTPIEYLICISNVLLLLI